MKAGQTVICISEDFPQWKTTSEDKSGTGRQAKQHPIKGEILVTDEVLGEFLRFDKYDTPDSYNWWKSDRFAPINEHQMEEEISELITHLTPNPHR